MDEVINDFDWQDEWEKAAGAEYQYFSLYTDLQLQLALQDQVFGSHFRIWDVIRDRGSKQLIWPLFVALKNLTGTAYFHDRHNCIDAIFHLAGIKNQALRKRLLGPSNEFDPLLFMMAMAELKQKIKNKLAKIH